MKELLIIIRPEKLETVKSVLDNQGCHGMTILSVMGCGAQKGITEGTNVIKGMKTNINLLPKIMVLAVLPDDAVSETVLKIEDAIRTGHVGDGKIFIKNIEDAVRMRTGERGDAAL